MGQEEHEETPDCPPNLDPGLDSGPDLVYLHLTGPHCALEMEEDPGPKPQGERDAEEEKLSDDGSATEETGDSENEVEKQEQPVEGGSNHGKNTHQPLCRTQCVDLGADGPPDLPPDSENLPQSSAASSEKEDGGSKEYQAKLDFALKLGYSEEVVRSVLTKLGPETLINDVLGELVRLGTKAESDQGLGSGQGVSTGAGVGSVASCGRVDEGRADSPALPESLCDQENLRPIVVDGSNVAMSHGNKEVFSCQGIQLAVDWFLERGHQDITVFVPAWRKEQSRPDAPITDQEILRRLEKQKVLVFTPSRRVQGRRVVCYDDRFIVKLAFESDGIIVSNDNYRDLANEKPEWKRFIDERLLMYSFVNDKFMPPDDPLGRHGPSLDNFLRKRPVIPEQKKQPCPYGKKCTYGHKCKYYHPERGAQPQRAVADELRASAKTSLTPKAQAKVQTKTQTDPGLVKSHSVPTGEAQRKGSGSKRQSDPSVRALSYSDAEERLLLKNLSSNSSSRTMSPAPGGPPTTASSLPQDELPRAGTPHGHALEPQYPICHSPEYYCVTRAYSNLSLSSRPSPDPRPPQDHDYRLGSLGSMGSTGSECSGQDYRLGSLGSMASTGSECSGQDYRLGSLGSMASTGSGCSGQDYRLGSLGSMASTGSECSGQDYRLGSLGSMASTGSECSGQDYRLGSLGSMGSAGSECGSESSSCDSCPPESLMDDFHYTHSRFYAHPPHDYCAHASEYSYPSHSSHPTHPTHPSHPPHTETPPKRPLYPLPPHLHHQPLSARSSCPGDYHHSPLPSPGSPLGRCLAPSLAESVSDSRLYEHFAHGHLPHARPKVLPHWDTYYRPPLPTSRYESSCYWDSYSGPSHYPPPPPPHPHPGLSSYPPPRTDSPARARHGDAREKVYRNLCNIFPSELVSRVMSRSPHLTDPQQLAAAILAEKAQSGY